VETWSVEDGAGTDEERVEVDETRVEVVGTRVEVDEVRMDIDEVRMDVDEARVKVELDCVLDRTLDDTRTDDEAGELVHVPNFELHPLPQYALVFPQYPNLLQQSPNEDFRHVNPLVPPHVPSVDTLAGITGGVIVPQVPYPD
jgi:hypothetical protein